MKRTLERLALAVALAIAIPATFAAVIVQLRVIEGEGAVHSTASRLTRGITVQVTDETGKPVDGATISFRLPEDGPGGVFSSGLRTEVVSTHADGRATIWGIQWNKTPGPFELRITAVKDQARAGLVSQQYLSDGVASKGDAGAPKSGGTGEFRPSHRLPTKWLLIGMAGAAGAGAAVMFTQSKSPSSGASSIPSVVTQIGLPSIYIGGPPK